MAQKPHLALVSEKDQPTDLAAEMHAKLDALRVALVAFAPELSKKQIDELHDEVCGWVEDRLS